MNGILVVYHSRSGATAAVARSLAELVGADLEAISPLAPRPGPSGFLNCLYEAVQRRKPAIAPTRDPSGYRLVIVGSPVWAGCVSSPVLTYLTTHRRALTEVAAFCTSGSGVATSVFAQIEALLRGRPLRARLSLTHDAALTGDAEPDLEAWARRLKAFADLPGRSAA